MSAPGWPLCVQQQGKSWLEPTGSVWPALPDITAWQVRRVCWFLMLTELLQLLSALRLSALLDACSRSFIVADSSWLPRPTIILGYPRLLERCLVPMLLHLRYPACEHMSAEVE